MDKMSIVRSPWFKTLDKDDSKLFKQYIYGAPQDMSPSDMWRMIDLLIEPKLKEVSKFSKCEARAAGACKCIDRCEPFPEGTGKKSLVSFPLTVSDLEGYEVNLIRKT